MSEEKATPTGANTGTTPRKSTLSSRRRAAAKPSAASGPALPPERDDAYQAVARIWPD